MNGGLGECVHLCTCPYMNETGGGGEGGNENERHQFLTTEIQFYKAQLYATMFVVNVNEIIMFIQK